ncbi:MAG: nitrogen fixation protein NifQ [Rhodospirillales bacterium]|nr:MAG: nitrogen fixation protein NifQ [Rhodospirillales bacterium]
MLVSAGRGDPFDRHVFASALALAGGTGAAALPRALGLDRQGLIGVAATYFPQVLPLMEALPADAGSASDPGALEEDDLRRLLLDHRSRGVLAENWLATIIARRSLGPNHLWQDLGLTHRSELGRLMHRHFAALAACNVHDMKWKKFFYRQLCERDGVLICKAPNCTVCDDVHHCFAPEAGEPLNVLQQPVSRT